MYTEYAPCPHCGRELRRGSNYAVHIKSCLADPAIYATTKAALTDGDTGRIRLISDYDADTRGGIGRNTLFKRLGVYSWRDVALRFGLESVPDGRAEKREQAARWERVGAEIDAEMAANRALRFSCGKFRM